jgi:hypothetical protein
MTRYHFSLIDQDHDVLGPIVTADLDNDEEIKDRAELIAHLLLMAESEGYEDDPREILVTDDDGHEVLSLALSEIRKKLSDD